jgi:hypothetical protein
MSMLCTVEWFFSQPFLTIVFAAINIALFALYSAIQILFHKWVAMLTKHSYALPEI